ncbi:hypothetical protein ACLMJK_006012 [Lecanora helva]
MSAPRHTSSPSRPRPVPNSPSQHASRGRSPPAESASRATSIARLTSPITTPAQGTPPPSNRQILHSSQSNTESQTPLAGPEGSHSSSGPGQSALAAALQGSLGTSPRRYGTPPVRAQSPIAGGIRSHGSGPQTTYGSFESRSARELPRRVSGAPNEDPRVVKRHLVQPANLDTSTDSGQGPLPLSHRSSAANFPNKNTDTPTTGIGEDEFSSLRLQGGDITREVYRWTEEAESEALPGARGKRSKSWHIPRSERTSEDLDANTIRKPGGFRRDYLRRRAPSPSSESQGDQSGLRSGSRPRILTKSFYEFLSVYGHFAGEELEEDDEDNYLSSGLTVRTDYEAEENEREDREPGEGSALLTPGTRSRRKTGLKEKGATGNNSPMGAALLLLKSFVGTGVLFLPRAYLNGGMLFSNLVLLGVALLSYYCFILLVNTCLEVPGSFGDMGGKIYGEWLRRLILTSVALSQIGFVSAYIVFTSESMQAFVTAVSHCRSFIDIKYMVLMQLIIFLPLSLIRDITKLGGTAIIADAFILLGLVYIGYYDSRTLYTHGIGDIKMFNPQDWTLFIGTAIFTFEGVGLIIPIQESMKQPSKFPSVLAVVMVIIIVVFTAVGALSYAAFGSATKTVVLLNLPQDSRSVNAVQLLYSLAILLSTPLQLFPAIRILETGLFSRSGKFNPYVKWEKNVFRFFLVVVCAVIAYAGANDLDKFVALVGSFACVPLVYVYPAMLHYRAVARTTVQKVGDFTLGIFGAVVMMYTTVLTIQSWVRDSGARPPGYCDE